MVRLVEAPHCTRAELEEELGRLGLLTNGVRAAMEVAVRAHGAQARDDGTPYLEEHVWPIGRETAAYVYGRESVSQAEREQAVIVALLHDTLEDCEEITAVELQDAFGAEVAKAVVALTKPARVSDGAEARLARDERYFAGLREGPQVARVVKILDRLNNLACIHKSGEEKRRGYLEETRAFHLPLAQDVDEALAERLARQLRALES